MAYQRCPKCGHCPLPRDQALPAACPACGLVLAKFAAISHRVSSGSADRSVEATGGESGATGLLSHWLLHVPGHVARPNWIARVATLAAFTAWTLWIWRDADVARGQVGSHFLHAVLLPFHEAGHYAIFRWFGPFLMTLGGTLGQHLMPIVLGTALLLRRRDPFGAALFLWLLGFSTLDMAVYMYDAFDPKLMLLGGMTGAESDGHDWQNLFGDMGLIHRARGIGLFFGFAGKALMVAALAWATWIVKRQRARLSDSPLAETDLEAP